MLFTFAAVIICNMCVISFRSPASEIRVYVTSIMTHTRPSFRVPTAWPHVVGPSYKQAVSRSSPAAHMARDKVSTRRLRVASRHQSVVSDTSPWRCLRLGRDPLPPGVNRRRTRLVAKAPGAVRCPKWLNTSEHLIEFDVFAAITVDRVCILSFVTPQR